ncbi:MAG: undecaprenyldiphospho-muramoylpentapeptide beta-N-acetylglucosaminyltransferase [Planctomycetota bacterium]
MRILFAGGGTGGHLVPGISVAEVALARKDTILFLTAGRPVEEKILGELPKAPLPLEFGGGAPGMITIAARLPRAVAAARKYIQQFKPDVFVGLGGLASFPAAVAAKICNVPVALLEINAVPGRATRWLRPFANKIFVSSEIAAREIGKKAVLTGTPLRAGFSKLTDPAGARLSFGLDPAAFTILILGGSQGALAVNRAIQGILSDLAKSNIQILWITGPGKEGELEQLCLSTPGLRAAVIPYINDTPRAYAAADLAICRTGAATVAELGALGLPSIGIPYPHHRDRQQYRNAELLGGGIIVIDERELTSEKLASTIDTLFRDRGRLSAMAAIAKERGRRDGAEAVLRELLNLAKLHH